MSNGTNQWLLQRFSALILLAYTLYLLCVVLSHLDTPFNYSHLVSLYKPLWMRLFTTLTLIALAAHTWVGMWSITTDYLTERALGQIGNGLRLVVQALIVLLLFAYLGIGLSAVWLQI